MIRNVIFLIIFFIFSEGARVNDDQAIFIFTEDSSNNINELESVSDFKNLLSYPATDTDHIHIVMFYSSFCPHCRLTAPIYTKIAQSFQNLSHNLTFYAFECANGDQKLDRHDDADTPKTLCRKEGVDKFPHVNAYIPKKFLNENKLPCMNKDDDSGDTIKCTLSDMTGADIDSIYSQELFTRKELTSSVIDGLAQWIIEEILTEKTSDLIDIGIVDHINGGNASRYRNPLEQIAEKSSKSTTEPTRWSRLDQYHDAEILLYEAIQALHYFLRNSINQKLSNDKLITLYQLIFLTTNYLPGLRGICEYQQLIEYIESILENKDTYDNKKYHEILDSIHTLGIPMISSETIPKFLILESFSSGLWVFLHLLSISNFNKNDGFNFLLSIDRYYTNASFPSKNCKNKFRHSTRPDQFCTFHQSLLMEHIPFLFEIESKSIKTSLYITPDILNDSPQTMAHIFYRVIRDFFKCEDCRNHFIFGYKNKAAGRDQWLPDENLEVSLRDDKISPQSTYEGLVLWLWRFHSMVTFRTGTEKTAINLMPILTRHPELDDDSMEELINRANNTDMLLYQDVRFPSPKMCPECRIKDFKYSNKTVTTIIPELVYSMIMNNPNLKPPNVERQSFIQLDETKTFDVIDDFNLTVVLEFLVEYYWNSDWNNPSLKLTWISQSSCPNVI